MLPDRVPSYSELLKRTDAPAGSAWGLFGPDDQLGSINHMTPERVLAALKLVKRGETFSLDYPINHFPPNTFRKLATHVIFGRHKDMRDDYLDSYYLQGTTQLDGFRHRRHTIHGFYNGTPDEVIEVGRPELGVQHWAERGIVGRGVLIDIERHLARTGRRLDYDTGEPFTVRDLDEAAAAQKVELRPGDILLMRGGWASYFFALPPEERAARRARPPASNGLLQSRETAAWLWDRQFTLVAADNAAVETVPVADPVPFATDTDHGMMHQELIALLGIALGELFRLDDLAEDCARDGVYEFFFVSKPLSLVGGVGSPANALAIK
jgi:kynurenine formamidase